MQFIKSALIPVVVAMIMCSCSPGNDQEKEKGTIEAMTEKAGKDAVKAIKTPMEKAQAAADLASKKAQETTDRKKEE